MSSGGHGPDNEELHGLPCGACGAEPGEPCRWDCTARPDDDDGILVEPPIVTIRGTARAIRSWWERDRARRAHLTAIRQETTEITLTAHLIEQEAERDLLAATACLLTAEHIVRDAERRIGPAYA